jgi:hypothetical protein
MISKNVDIDTIIGNIPNFGTTLYENPKIVYDNICEHEELVRDKIEVAEIRKNKLSYDLVNQCTLNDTVSNALQDDNDSVLEKYRSICRSLNVMRSYLDRIRRSREKFESFFKLLYDRPAYENFTYRHTEYSEFRIFDTLEHAAKRCQFKEEDGVPIASDVVENYINRTPGLLNFVRFHSFEPQLDKTMYFKIEDKLCVGLRDIDGAEMVLVIDVKRSDFDDENTGN